MKNIEKKLQESIQLLKKLNLVRDEIIEEIKEEIDAIPDFKGVVSLQNSPHCAVVRLSALSSDCWAPSYYIAEEQKEAIRKNLDKCDKNLEKITENIAAMLKNKSVKNGSSITKLNEESIKTLQRIFNGLSILRSPN